MLGRKFTPLFLTEYDKHNHKPVNIGIQYIKTKLGKIRNVFGTGVMDDQNYMWGNHVSRTTMYPGSASITGKLMRNFGEKYQKYPLFASIHGT